MTHAAAPAEVHGPVAIELPPVAEQPRWKAVVRALAALPALVVAVGCVLGGLGVAVVAWGAVLATGRQPSWTLRLVRSAVARFATAAAALAMVTDGSPVRVELGPPTTPTRRSVAARWLVGLPAAAASVVVAVGAVPAAVFAWAATVVGRGVPRSLAQALATVVSFQVRTLAWLVLATSVAPHGLLAGPAPKPADPSTGGAAVPPDVFTFVGPTWLWGYSADRRTCGIWRRAAPNQVAGTWPVERQREGWARFRELEPTAVEVPPTAAAELGVVAPPSPSATPAVRRLVGAMVALGVAAFVGYGAVAFATAGPRPATVGPVPGATLARAYGRLRSAVLTYATSTERCTASSTGAAEVGCATEAAGRLAAAFGQFGRTLASLPAVAGRAVAADRRALAAATAACQEAFGRLGAATTVTGYDLELAALDVHGLLGRFDSAYGRLAAALAAA